MSTISVDDDAWADALIAKLVNDRVENFAYAENERLSEAMALIQQASESPIEAKLGFALVTINDDMQYGMPFDYHTAFVSQVPSLTIDYLRGRTDLMKTAYGVGADSYIAMGFQVNIGAYRADIALSCSSGSLGWPSFDVVVECDGHEFHERTKQQAARDRARDRAMSAAGLIVMRFTGSEIHADAEACANEVMHFIWKKATGRVWVP